MVHGTIVAAELLVVHSLCKNPDWRMTCNSMSELYLSSNRSEEGENHVNWLVNYLDEEASRVSLAKALAECYKNPLQQEVLQN